MKNFVLAAALSIPAAAAMAADLPSAAPPAPAAPIFTGFDAFGSVAAGYNWGTVQTFATRASANGLELSARGSISTPVAAGFGVQVDGQFERSAYKINGADLRRNTSEVAGHVFWRDSNKGLLGLFGQVSSTETNVEIMSDGRYFIGAEGQYYLGAFTLYAQAAYEKVNFDFTNSAIASIKADGFVGAAQVRYFMTPDLMVALTGGYENVSAGNIGNGRVRHTAWLVGAKIENRFSGTPFSVFAEADCRRGTFNIESTRDNETRAQIGLKFNFGSSTLMQRDRAGASLDPIRSLKAVIPILDPI